MSIKKYVKEMLNEKKYTNKVYYVNDELWVAYAQGAGSTIQLPNINKKYISNKSGDPSFDSSVDDLVKFGNENKPLKSKNNMKLFQIVKYDHIKPATADKYDIWGGTQKPIGKFFMIIDSNGKNTVVNFFETKNEALNWFKTTN